MDYDVVTAAHGTVVAWNGSYYGSLAKFTAATGQEAHGVQAPAGFADPANGNLSLTPGSPAVDSAFSGTLSTPLGLDRATEHRRLGRRAGRRRRHPEHLPATLDQVLRHAGILLSRSDGKHAVCATATMQPTTLAWLFVPYPFHRSRGLRERLRHYGGSTC
jgi:hypothetical protein